MSKKRTQKKYRDFLQPRVNQKTVYKLIKDCVICGNEENLNMHHVKHVRKVGDKD